MPELGERGLKDHANRWFVIDAQDIRHVPPEGGSRFAM
jgi:hypothetical protein